MTNENKWQPLELKLKKGIPFEQACVEAGVNIDAAKEYVNAKKELDKFQDAADRYLFRECIKTALDELKAIIAECPDMEVRRRAAKDLLDFYRDERKRLEGNLQKAKGSKGDVLRDLFDASPWSFPSD